LHKVLFFLFVGSRRRNFWKFSQKKKKKEETTMSDAPVQTSVSVTKTKTKRMRKSKRARGSGPADQQEQLSNVQCVCLQLRVEGSRVEAVQKWFSQVAKLAHTQPGHMMSSLVMPSCEVGSDRDVLILYAFSSPETAAAWHASETKLSVMKSLAPLVKSAVVLGGSGALRVDDGNTHFGAYSNGWESSFVPDTVLPALTEGSEKRRAVVPPRWKQAVAVYIAVCIVSILFGLPGSLAPTISVSVGVPEHPWRSPLVPLLSNLIGVPVIVFIVLPIVVKLLGPWLHMSKPEAPPADSPAVSRFCYSTFC
jgi:antibiotic biosynthesis monooxygenase (ABM) superfamily enzyme